MANQLNLSNVKGYIELSGDSILLTNSLVYVELNSSEIRLSDALAYVEIAELPDRFELVYHGFMFPISQLNVVFSLSSADATTLISQATEKVPILPDWAINITGFWNRQIALKVGNLTDQPGRGISIHVTDRYGDSINLYNSSAFISSYVTDINIDNVMIYRITFVGSGILNTL